MKKLYCTALLLAFAAMPTYADTADELDTWFRDGYAALYVENAWDRADEFAQYFAPIIAYRSDEGLAILDVDGFLVDSLEVWRDEGWVGTDVANLETRLLNASTAVFDIKWLDRNGDGSTGYECGWYIADKLDGPWLLSQYIQTACAD